MQDKHQDYIYLKENYYDNPKEVFSFAKDLIPQNKDLDLLDIGCARGEFLYFLKNSIPYKSLMGIDYSPQLIEQAKSFEGLKGVDFEVRSAEEFDLGKQFDIITMLGVSSYFDDPYLFLSRIQKHLKSKDSNGGGRAFVLSFFNDYDVDVLVQYRNNNYFDTFEKGWNFISLKTMERTLERLDMTIHHIHKFELSFDLHPQEDPCRTWHIKLIDGERKYINGLGQIFDLRLLEITHK